MLRALLELSRVSNLPTVWTNVLAAWIIASGKDWQWTPSLGWLLLGASLIYSAGMILNDACDVIWDRQHRPERPIPSGRIGLTTVWVIGLTWLLGGAALMVLAGGASWKITALLVAAVVAYDVYHKPWAGSVIIMGACRTLLYLAAGSAAITLQGDMADPQWGILGTSGTLLGLYIVALTLIARGEAKGGMEYFHHVPLMLLLIMPFGFGVMLDSKFNHKFPFLPSWEWIIALWFITWTAIALWKMKKRGPAIGQAVGLLLAGIPLVDALFVAPLSLPTALCFCALPPILRLWQRWVAAT